MKEKKISEQRMGEIALAVVKARLKKEGLKLSGSTLRELGSLSQETGVAKEELHEFTMAILPEIIGNALGYPRVSLICGDDGNDRQYVRKGDHNRNLGARKESE